MEGFLEIISKRSMPGVLIFDLDERLLFANGEALELVPGLAGEPIERLSVWEGIRRLLAFLKEHPAEPASRRNISPLRVMETGDGSVCSLRASYLGAAGRSEKPTHVMVLVERVVEKHGVDLERAGRQFGLSQREQQVLQLICQGFMNRDIGERLFISEHTVKDHVKNIMKKMGVGTRSEIMAVLQ
ncbi:helix-turn-helix transcriptional regulator [Geobacter luticola]|uniref:Helix-turn-helix transcriptional regulator n=2 Tax=Geomobilimonas luticola TaxID=1114878 RepID=A0ABS5SAX9_9BACT|nr:helix-turn-helix transcriptional regulator [Geomobilimonas luticola]